MADPPAADETTICGVFRVCGVGPQSMGAPVGLRCSGCGMEVGDHPVLRDGDTHYAGEKTEFRAAKERWASFRTMRRGATHG